MTKTLNAREMNTGDLIDLAGHPYYTEQPDIDMAEQQTAVVDSVLLMGDKAMVYFEEHTTLYVRALYEFTVAE